MLPRLRERYLAVRNAQVIAVITAGNRSEAERFWDAMEKMEKEAKVLRLCLDDHSRSKMRLHMLSMIRVGMLSREDLAEFSDELRQELSFVFSENAADEPRDISVAEGIALGEQAVRDGRVRSQTDAKRRLAR